MPGEEFGDTRSLVVNGDYHVEVQGDTRITCRGGEGITFEADGGGAGVTMHAVERIALLAQDAGVVLNAGAVPESAKIDLIVGPAGKIVLAVGIPMLGPRIEMDESSITLAVGPKVGGARITLGPEGLTFKYGTASYEIGPLGVLEKMAATSRKLSVMGQEVTAAETTHKVGVEGITVDAPISKESVLGAVQRKATLATEKVDGVAVVSAGIENNGA